MAQYQSHISFSVIIGLLYAFFGYSFFNIYYEVLILGAVIIAITGILPDIDASQSSPAKELAGLIAASMPLLLLEYFPKLHSSGTVRVALVVICAYLITRLIVVRGLEVLTEHRGTIHSIPVAILIFEIVYFIFSDSVRTERLFLASAAFVGFMSHLILDAYSNLDIIGAALGKSKSGEPALKLMASSFTGTLIMYSIIGALGWNIAADFYPKLHKISLTKASVSSMQKKAR